MSKRYAKSEALLERALRTIPLGAQTFSKSRTQFPFGVSPYFITHGSGSKVVDADGNEYVDFINSLAAIVLGYRDPDVDNAVRQQLEEGSIFSLSHPIEAQVAEEIVKVVPSAQMVRFGKNGSDATAGAVRLARAFTNRDRIATCGYHGWQDWYIGSTTRNRGVPQATRDLTHGFRYNDLESLHALFKQHPGEFAAVIMEPMNIEEPKDHFLHKVQELARKNGALFILDETITGFRYHVGGAQALFGLQPDLSAFGKALANGYPVSAIAGRADVMKLMEEVFFSFTFGGETLSLAAALATLRKLQREPVTDHLASFGRKVIDRVNGMIGEFNLGKHLRLSGHPSWSFLTFEPGTTPTVWELKTLFLQEMFSQGILILGTHNICYAHGPEDSEKLAGAYRHTLGIIAEVVEGRPIREVLRCQPLEPLFKVR